MSKSISLTRGKQAIVDDEDFEWISKHKWLATGTGTKFYAARHTWDGIRVSRIYMHREILNLPKGIEVDHINGNGLDNRRSNLRQATRAENQRNRMKSSHSVSIYKGVSFDKRRNRWRARIKVDQKEKWIGFFMKEIDAAYAYDRVARQYFGNYANLNFKD